MPKRNVLKNTRQRFGARLRRLRERKGLGQAELAEHCGISRENISRLENGRIEPTLATIEAIAGCFGMTISQLLKGV